METNYLAETDGAHDVPDEHLEHGASDLFVAEHDRYILGLSRRPALGPNPMYQLGLWFPRRYGRIPEGWDRPIDLLTTNNYEAAVAGLQERLAALPLVEWHELPEMQDLFFDRVHEALMLNGDSPFGPEEKSSIYDDLDYPTRRALAIDWVSGRFRWGFGDEPLKLLAKFGHLVAAEMTPLVEDLANTPNDDDWRHYYADHLAYLASMPPADAERLALRFLDFVSHGFRGGLLMACYWLDIPSLDEAVKAKYH